MLGFMKKLIGKDKAGRGLWATLLRQTQAYRQGQM